MRYPGYYKVDGKEVKDFKQLDDEKALKLVVLIYNVKREGWEDGIARDIALQEYIKLLEKRNSPYIKKSGIFTVNYEKVKLSSWKDEDLIKFYRELLPRARNYYIDSAADLTEVQNAERILYLTALSVVNTEMKKRRNTRNAVTTGSEVLLGALMIALSFI